MADSRPSQGEWSDLFVSRRIWSCHAGGYWWRAEGIRFKPAGTEIGWDQTATGTAATKWQARRKMTKYAKRWEAENV